MELDKVKNLAAEYQQTGYQNTLKLALVLTRLFCEVFSQLNMLIVSKIGGRSRRREVNDIAVVVILRI